MFGTNGYRRAVADYGINSNFAKSKAAEHGVTGWVSNAPKGEVILLFALHVSLPITSRATSPLLIFNYQDTDHRRSGLEAHADAGRSEYRSKAKPKAAQRRWRNWSRN